MIARVINLARAPERWATISRLAAERGLPIERIEAVDGGDPAALAVSGAVPGSLRPGEIACFESHRIVWQRVADDDAPLGLVLEDDVFLAADLVAFLDALADGPAVDIVKLNAHPRGMLLRLAPLAEVAGRRLLVPVQGTSDSSAYVISRDYAVRALEAHRRYSRPLDLALFDPALCPAIAQAEPALTIQQRYADFRFLDEGANKTYIQQQPERKPRPTVWAAITGEAGRVWRRRLVPAAQPLLNLGRPEADRVAFRRIAFRA